MNCSTAENNHAKKAQTTSFMIGEIIQVMSDAVAVLDLEGICVSANSRLGDMIGMKENDIVGKHFLDMPGIRNQRREEKNKLQFLLSRTIERGNAGPVYTAIIGSQLQEIPVRVSGRTLRDVENRLTYVIIVVYNPDLKLEKYSENLEKMIRERNEKLQETKEELARNEKLAILGQLSGSVAHELRNPLGSITNSAYFLNMRLKGADEKVRKHINSIEMNVQRANRIITDLLNASKVRKSSFRNSSMNAIIMNTLNEIEIPEAISVQTRLDQKIERIKLDSDQIQQAFSNIISNALQAMPHGGILEVESKIEDKFLCVVFSDSGEGISEENLQKIFEPLFTTRSKGFGLGLVVAKDIIEKHNGMIEAKSKVGEGTRVTVRLPLQE